MEWQIWEIFRHGLVRGKSGPREQINEILHWLHRTRTLTVEGKHTRSPTPGGRRQIDTIYQRDVHKIRTETWDEQIVSRRTHARYCDISRQSNNTPCTTSISTRRCLLLLAAAYTCTIWLHREDWEFAWTHTGIAQDQDQDRTSAHSSGNHWSYPWEWLDYYCWLIMLSVILGHSPMIRIQLLVHFHWSIDLLSLFLCSSHVKLCALSL